MECLNSGSRPKPLSSHHFWSWFVVLGDWRRRTSSRPLALVGVLLLRTRRFVQVLRLGVPVKLIETRHDAVMPPILRNCLRYVFCSK